MAAKAMFSDLSSENVASNVGRDPPERDGQAHDDPDQAEDPEGHADHMNRSGAHFWKNRQNRTIKLFVLYELQRKPSQQFDVST